MLPGRRPGSARCASKVGFCNVTDVQCGDAACGTAFGWSRPDKLRTGTHLWDRNAERYGPIPNILVPLEDKPYPEREERGERVNRIDSLVVVVFCSREEEGMYGVPDSRQNRIHFLAAGVSLKER